MRPDLTSERRRPVQDGLHPLVFLVEPRLHSDSTLSYGYTQVCPQLPDILHFGLIILRYG